MDEIQRARELALEPSTNTHMIKSDEEIESEDLGDAIMHLKVPNGKAIVTHGEHKTIATEHKHVMKHMQQEYNPVAKAMQIAFD